MDNKFKIGCTSDKIWNYNKLLDFLIVNQNTHIELTVDPEAICLENLGLYNLLDKFSFTQVNIITWNPLEKHNKYNILYKGKNSWFTSIKKIDTSLHTWNHHKVFYCLFGRPTASRLGLCAHLYNHYKEKSHLHFLATTNVDELSQIELDKLLNYDIHSIGPAGILIKQLPLLLSSSALYTKFNGYDFSDPLTAYYQDILIDIVAESHVAGNTFFPTEKTIRPMWLKKPFIMFASKNYLDYLHQMRFKTFCNFWSEEYDGYEGKERYVRILELIDNLAQKSTIELDQMYQGMQEILDYNYNLLVKQNYNNNITYIK